MPLPYKYRIFIIAVIIAVQCAKRCATRYTKITNSTVWKKNVVMQPCIDTDGNCSFMWMEWKKSHSGAHIQYQNRYINCTNTFTNSNLYPYIQYLYIVYTYDL